LELVQSLFERWERTGVYFGSAEWAHPVVRLWPVLVDLTSPSEFDCSTSSVRSLMCSQVKAKCLPWSNSRTGEQRDEHGIAVAAGGDQLRPDLLDGQRRQGANSPFAIGRRLLTALAGFAGRCPHSTARWSTP
jgi:hypothetical protein